MGKHEEYRMDQDDKEPESVTLTAGGESVTLGSLDMFGITIAQKMFKASIAYTDRTGKELRINLYTQAEAFKDAQVKFKQTSYIVDKDGRIVSMGEVNGAWVS